MKLYFICVPTPLISVVSWWSSHYIHSIICILSVLLCLLAGALPVTLPEVTSLKVHCLILHCGISTGQKVRSKVSSTPSYPGHRGIGHCERTPETPRCSPCTVLHPSPVSLMNNCFSPPPSLPLSA